MSLKSKVSTQDSNMPNEHQISGEAQLTEPKQSPFDPGYLFLIELLAKQKGFQSIKLPEHDRSFLEAIACQVNDDSNNEFFWHATEIMVKHQFLPEQWSTVLDVLRKNLVFDPTKHTYLVNVPVDCKTVPDDIAEPQVHEPIFKQILFDEAQTIYTTPGFQYDCDDRGVIADVVKAVFPDYKRFIRINHGQTKEELLWWAKERALSSLWGLQYEPFVVAQLNKYGCPNCRAKNSVYLYGGSMGSSASSSFADAVCKCGALFEVKSRFIYAFKDRQSDCFDDNLPEQPSSEHNWYTVNAGSLSTINARMATVRAMEKMGKKHPGNWLVVVIRDGKQPNCKVLIGKIERHAFHINQRCGYYFQELFSGNDVSEIKIGPGSIVGGWLEPAPFNITAIAERDSENTVAYDRVVEPLCSFVDELIGTRPPKEETCRKCKDFGFHFTGLCSSCKVFGNVNCQECQGTKRSLKSYIGPCYCQPYHKKVDYYKILPKSLQPFAFPPYKVKDNETIKIMRNGWCRKCVGTGKINFSKCRACRGRNSRMVKWQVYHPRTCKCKYCNQILGGAGK